MNSERTFIATILLLFACISGIYAQEAIPASGGDASGTGGTANWTVGQVGYVSATNEFGSVNPGVQQPYEVIMVANEEPQSDIAIELYPNPVQIAFILQFDKSLSIWDGDEMSCSIYDLDGKQVQDQVITQATAIVQMKDLMNGIYIVKIAHDHQAVKTFKIFKTN